MNKIVLFDTSIASDNLGDEIIMDAITNNVRDMYPHYDFVNVPTHIPLTRQDRDGIASSDIGLVCGTNLLCANWLFRSQWKVGIFDAFTLRCPVLMGVGWKFYQHHTDFITAIFLRKLLSKTYLHSVRDSYTEKRLRDVGISNVINTSCPTMWQLTPEHCATIQTRRAPHVVVTVTAYRYNLELDKKWLEVLLASYDKIYFWAQMQEDTQYIAAMNLDKRIEVIEPNLRAYDNALTDLDVDFIGTRLHAGIRALQKKRRTLILEVDNRAVEIAYDTKLPTARRDGVDYIRNWINSDAPTTLSLPLDNIARWKEQFVKQI